MKFLDRFILRLFALIIGIMAVLLILFITGILPVSYITDVVSFLTDGTKIMKYTLIVCSVLLLFVLKGLCFQSRPEKDGKEGIVLENTNGKLVISKDTLDNIISGVARDIPGTESTSSRTIVDKNRNLKVYVTTLVNRDVMIKDVSKELQEKVIDAMKKTADLDVKEVNIKVKNVTSKKLKGLPNKKVDTLPESTENNSEEVNNDETGKEVPEIEEPKAEPTKNDDKIKELPTNENGEVVVNTQDE